MRSRGVFNGAERIEPALEAGGVLEIDVAPRTAIRIDTGRLIVPFGSEPILGGVPPYSRTPGTTSGPVATIGVQFRF